VRERKRDLVLLRLSLSCVGHGDGSAMERKMERENLREWF